MKIYFNSEEIIDNVHKLDLDQEGDFICEFVEFDNDEDILESFTIYGELVNYAEDGEEVRKLALIDVVEAEPVANTDKLSAGDFVKTEWRYFDILLNEE